MRKIIFFLLILMVVLVSSCSSGSPQAQSTATDINTINPVITMTRPAPTNTQAKPIFPTLTPLPTKPSSEPPASAMTGFLADFPLAPDTEITYGGDSQDEPDAKNGQFTLSSVLPVQDLVAYYEKTLPTQGWTLRYIDPNHTGGVNQEWKKDRIYLSMDFGYPDTGLVVQAFYSRVDSADLDTLPKGFPLPENAELIKASESSWEFYIPQEYTGVSTYYEQKLAALQWTQKPGYGGGSMGGEGDGDGGSSGPQYPPGVKPMPTPTYDPRSSRDLAYVMPDTNEVWLTITPHGQNTIMQVDLTLKQASAAGLPADFPIYQGAEIQFVSPGSLAYTVKAGIDEVKEFYETEMKAAGWAHDGNSFESPGAFLQAWKKDPLQVTIALAEAGEGSAMVSVNCSGCE